MSMIGKRPSRRQMLWAAVLAAVSGCAASEADDPADGPDFSNLVPASGVVTLNGKPLAGAVVTFLPRRWSPGVGETDANGAYHLSSSGREGVSAGHYKVAISFLVSAEGEPQGVGPRSSLFQPPGMLSARERLPAEYSDLSRTRLVADVSGGDGTFDFDLSGPADITSGVVAPKREEPSSVAEEAAPREAAPGND